MQKNERVSASFYGWLAIITVAAYLVHEAAHWLVGAALGYEVS